MHGLNEWNVSFTPAAWEKFAARMQSVVDTLRIEQAPRHPAQEVRDDLEPIERIQAQAIEISGPYHYVGDKHPCLRLDANNRILGVVYIVDGDEERACAEAYMIKEAFRLGGKEIDRLHYASGTSPQKVEADGVLRAKFKTIRQQIVNRVDSGAGPDYTIKVTNGDLCHWYDQLEVIEALITYPFPFQEEGASKP